MISRRRFLQSSLAASVTASNLRGAWAANAPGVTDAEIKIGQTMPYSGPATAYGVIGRAEVAFFKMINENGGVNGRKVNLISVDDGYSPPKTVEQTRRLVEQEQVAFIFGTVGSPTNAATRGYLNDAKIPQLLVASGSDLFYDPLHFPWSMGYVPSYRMEARAYGKHILLTKPDAKVGILYQNDGLGKDYLSGVRDGLGADKAGMIVKEVSYEVSEPTVDSQIATLQGAGVDTLVLGASAKFGALATRKIFDSGWAPTRYISITSAAFGVLKAAGLEKARGLICATSGKDPTEPRWKDDPGYLQWAAFATKNLAPNDILDGNAAFGWGSSLTLVQVLKQCGDDLSRDNIMRQAANLKDFELPLLLPGIKVNTSPDNYYAVHQFRLQRFNGANWELFGDLIAG